MVPNSTDFRVLLKSIQKGDEKALEEIHLIFEEIVRDNERLTKKLKVIKQVTNTI